MKYIFWML